MSITNHVFRRGAVYTWRRRIPLGARQGGRTAVLQLSLQTCGRREAQRLAAIVTAESDAVFWAMEHHGLSPAAAKALLERMIRAAQAQFARAELAAMDEAQAGAWQENLRFDRAAGHAFRLLAVRGRSATLTEDDRALLTREGMAEEDLARVERLLPIYARDFWGEGRMNRLRRELIESAGVPKPTLLDLQLARQVALRGRDAALIHRGQGRPGEDLKAEIELARFLAEKGGLGELSVILAAREVPASTTVPARESMHVEDAAPARLSANTTATQSMRKAEEVAVAAGDGPDTSSTISGSASAFDDPLGLIFSPRIRDVAERLAAAKSREKVEPKFLKQIAMVADMVVELTKVEDITLLRQPHLARFREALNKVPKNWGKSLKDRERSLLAIIQHPAGRMDSERGLAPATVNRNLGILARILDRARSEGLPVDSTLKPESLRAKMGKRARNARPAFTREDVRAIFCHPVWTGCKSRARRMQPGSTIIRDGLYWVPLIGAYTGARREEIAGLGVPDLVQAEEDGGWVFNIRFTESRRIKNEASVRRVPVHPHLIELGLLDHLEERRQRRDHDLFPDLKPSNPTDTYGDGIDESFRKIRRVQLGPESEGKVFHSFRHYVIDQLKRDRDLKKEEIKDIVGHAGEDETDERYGSTTPIEILRAAVGRLPRVT
jgi:integrase